VGPAERTIRPIRSANYPQDASGLEHRIWCTPVVPLSEPQVAFAPDQAVSDEDVAAGEHDERSQGNPVREGRHINLAFLRQGWAHAVAAQRPATVALLGQKLLQKRHPRRSDAR